MLNAEQQQAVSSDGHTVVVALPGAGKTHLSVQKVDRLLREHPDDCVATVTFTKEAADQLKAKVVKVSGEEPASRVFAGTFHRLAIYQLKRAGKMPEIAAGPKQYSLIARAVDAAGLNVSVLDAMRILERIKCSIELEVESQEEAVLLRTYTDLLARHGMCDLQDLVRLALQGMEAGTVEPLPVKFMLVDEFQDTDECQLRWVLFHAQNDIRVTVVGDDDQSIYRWRHALGYEGMMHFKEELDAQLITLGSNYRCREEILSAAERVIRNNDKRVVKTMLAARGPGGSVQLRQYKTRDSELVGLCEAVHGTDGIELRDDGIYYVPKDSWAVLVRNNHLIRLVAAELQSQCINVILPPGGKDIWAVPPLSYFIDILSSLSEGTTRGLDNVMSLAGVPEEMITDIHERTGGRLFKFVRINGSYSGGEKAPREYVNKLTLLVGGWRSRVAEGLLDLVVDGVAAHIESLVEPKMHQDLGYGVTLFRDRIQGTLGHRLRRVTSPKSKDERAGQQGVVLLTAHGSKGLEFEKVWMPFLEDGVFPVANHDGLDTLEHLAEERRLFYVAMTRAKNALVLSHQAAARSPFIGESGLEYTD